MTDRSHATRLYTVVGLLTTATVGLSCRLVFLHMGPHQALRERIRSSRITRTTIHSRRGRVFDCKGNLLALDIGGKDICADPSFIVTNGLLDELSLRLSDVLATDRDWIRRRLARPDRRFCYLQRFVPDDKAAPVMSLKLPGMFFRDVFVRSYPKGDLMCHVVGFCNYERVGCAGVEQEMERFLRGSPGERVMEKDGRRRELPGRRIRDQASHDGADVRLTIDQAVQYMVERALDRGLEEHGAKGGWAIVQRVLTGEVLAMASRPNYDPNRFRTVEGKALLNAAIAHVYEPGSTLKAVTIAAALDRGVVSPSQVYDCENGEWHYGGKRLRDYHPYGNLTVADGLKKSSNILAAKVALRLGDSQLEAYLRAFGFGRLLGVDLPGEEQGLLPPSKRWSKITGTRVAIGQGVAVTALQMLGAVCAIANDGFLMRPYVVHSVSDPRRGVLMQAQPEVLARPIRPQTAALMTKLLCRVVEPGGTGRRATVAGYRIAGKTGTAQKVVAGRYSESAYMASFVGFLPAEQPEIGIVVVIDEPQPYHTGGRVAAPIFKEIAGQAVRYLDIPPGGKATVVEAAAAAH